MDIGNVIKLENVVEKSGFPAKRCSDLTLNVSMTASSRYKITIFIYGLTFHRVSIVVEVELAAGEKYFSRALRVEVENNGSLGAKDDDEGYLEKSNNVKYATSEHFDHSRGMRAFEIRQYIGVKLQI